MTEALVYRFQHIHTYCSDIGASERWFVEGLGARVRQRFELIGAKATMLNLGGAPILLMQARENLGMATSTDPQVQAGTTSQLKPPHVGLAVDDLDAAVAELKRRGVGIREEPQQLTPSIRVVHIYGPDAMSVELIEGAESILVN